MEFTWPEAVAIESTRNDVVAGYGPEFLPDWDEVGAVAWFEGGHQRYFVVRKILEDTRDSFSFRDTEGAEHTLRTMTLELYEKAVRPRTMGKPTFESLSDLLAVMRLEW